MLVDLAIISIATLLMLRVKPDIVSKLIFAEILLSFLISSLSFESVRDYFLINSVIYTCLVFFLIYLKHLNPLMCKSWRALSLIWLITSVYNISSWLEQSVNSGYILYNSYSVVMFVIVTAELMMIAGIRSIGNIKNNMAKPGNFGNFGYTGLLRICRTDHGGPDR